MDSSTLDALEFPLVLDKLAGFTQSELGKRLSLDLTPLSSIEELEAEQQLIKEIMPLMDTGTGLPVSGITDLAPYLSKRSLPGYFVTAENFLAILSTIDVVCELRAQARALINEEMPRLFSLTLKLPDLKELALKIRRAIDENGHIKDSASKKLKKIRTSLKKKREECRRLLRGYITQEGVEGEEDGEYVTIRDDRLVVAIKAPRHASIKGVIHGRSATGLTFFIEPMEALGINNDLAELKRDEIDEEIEVLRELTAALFEMADEITEALRIAALIDLVQAKVRFLKYISGVVPVFSSVAELKMDGSRHPLLLFKELDGGGKVIEVDIMLKAGPGVLIISGANAGGKTVALKSIGLLTLMAMSALPVPVREGSTFVFYENIHTDIGDRQDIAEDLSTFSAHLKRMSEILGESSAGTIVLIDEIGVGTDPTEGGAIALAMLETLIKRGVSVVVTTHLNFLKAHGATDAGFNNASVLFDESNGRPLYKIGYGAPGSSFGLKAAAKYGVPKEVIERARELTDVKESAFSESLLSFEEKKIELEAEIEKLKEVNRRREVALNRIRDDRKKLIDKAQKKIDLLMEKAQKKIDQVFAETKAVSRRAATGKVLEVKQEVMAPLLPKEEPYYPSPGDIVRISGSMREATVVSVDKNKKSAEILSGGLKIVSAWSKLKKVAAKAATKKHVPMDKNLSEVSRDAAYSVNVIGLRVDEALNEVSAFLDAAHVEGLSEVQIIHGHGTGALKNAIRKFLKESRLVGEVKSGTELQGGQGVTIAILK